MGIEAGRVKSARVQQWRRNFFSRGDLVRRGLLPSNLSAFSTGITQSQFRDLIGNVRRGQLGFLLERADQVSGDDFGRLRRGTVLEITQGFPGEFDFIFRNSISNGL